MTEQDKIYSCPIEVRGYELDSFGHVNHSVYTQYFEHARWRVLQDHQINLQKFESWNAWPVIAEVHIKYLKPTFLGDQLIARTSVKILSKTSFEFYQALYREDIKVTEAQIRSVMVNKAGRPVEVPPEMRALCP